MSGLRAARHAPSRHAVTGPARQIRPQLVRAAVLPTLAAGLSGTAAVIFTLQLGGGAGERDARLWPVLTGCALLVLGALAAALLGAQRAAKAVRDRCESLRRSSVRGRQELRTAADRLERGETPPRPVRGGPTGPPPGADPAGVDEFWLLSQELRGAREQAHTTLVRLAGPAAPSDSERKVEVFVNLARRLQSLVHREISLLDDLEDTVEDPDLLKELFHVDHLATRIRRHAENLAVLGGAASRRQWTRPIDLSEVLRSSVAEVEQYTRVKVVPPAGGSVRGHAVADVVHLLAELVENATVFSAPDTDVVLRAERVTAGIAVEVEDRGLGMPAEEQHRMNALLGDPDQISVRHLLADGRIGLFVVSALARRHGIAVELKSNIYGGVLAVLVLPQELLGAEAPSAADAAGGSRATSWGTGESAAMPPLEPVRVTPPRLAPEPLPGRGARTGAEAWGAAAPGAGAAAPAPSVTGPSPVPAAPREAGFAPEPGAGMRSAPESGPESGAGMRSGAVSAPEPGAGMPEPEPLRGPVAAARPAHPSTAAATPPVGWPPHASSAPAASVAGPAAGPESGAVADPRLGHAAAAESAYASTGPATSVAGPEAGSGLGPGTPPGRGPGPLSGPESGGGPVPESGTRFRPGGVAEWESGAVADPRLGRAVAAESARGSTGPATSVAGPETGSGLRSGTPPGRGPGLLSAPEPGAGMRSGPESEPLRGPVAAARPAHASTAAATPPVGRPPHASSAPATSVAGPAAGPEAGSGLRPGTPPGRGPGVLSAPEFRAVADPRLGRAVAAEPARPSTGAATSVAGPAGGPESGAVTDPRLGRAVAAESARASTGPATSVAGPETGSGLRRGTPPGRGPGTAYPPLPVRRARGAVAEAAVMPLPAPRAGDGASAPAVAEPWAEPGSGNVAAGGNGEARTAAAERPPLPRRRAQEHLAPQLRDAPAPRRAADTDRPVHDPGLMAAFQRGFGLAQSENQV